MEKKEKEEKKAEIGEKRLRGEYNQGLMKNSTPSASRRSID